MHIVSSSPSGLTRREAEQRLRDAALRLLTFPCAVLPLLRILLQEFQSLPCSSGCLHSCRVQTALQDGEVHVLAVPPEGQEVRGSFRFAPLNGFRLLEELSEAAASCMVLYEACRLQGICTGDSFFSCAVYPDIPGASDESALCRMFENCTLESGETGKVYYQACVLHLGSGRCRGEDAGSPAARAAALLTDLFSPDLSAEEKIRRLSLPACMSPEPGLPSALDDLSAAVRACRGPLPA